jgi:two-component system sensor histidine kinase KdpD
MLAPLVTDYRGHPWQDLDVEEALRRRPQVLLVDELAHQNVPGAVREKRWQDVEHLLARGQNVIATLNVQHLESLNDAIFEMIGVRVRETVPDTFLLHAYNIRVVDLSPEELRDRLAEGKVYPPEVAGRARDHFFRTGNLTALRELTLRVLADYNDQRLRDYLDEHRIGGSWRARERILVAVTAEPHARRLVRRGFRLASRLQGEFHVCHVRQPERGPDPRFVAELEATLALARDLGAQVHLLDGNVYREILAFVTSRRITSLVMGISLKRTGRARLFRASLLDALQKTAPDMDILLVGQPLAHGEGEAGDDGDA